MITITTKDGSIRTAERLFDTFTAIDGFVKFFVEIKGYHPRYSNPAKYRKITLNRREVLVPKEELTFDAKHDLEKIYKYGQNDFQFVDGIRSVDIDDEVFYAGKRYKVAPMGWEEVVPVAFPTNDTEN